MPNNYGMKTFIETQRWEIMLCTHTSIQSRVHQLINAALQFFIQGIVHPKMKIMSVIYLLF